MFVKAYDDKRDHGGINGLTPSEMFLQTFNRSHNRNNTPEKCHLCGYLKVLPDCVSTATSYPFIQEIASMRSMAARAFTAVPEGTLT
jgi:hypothetical protein